MYLSLGTFRFTTNNTIMVRITAIGEDAEGGPPSLTCHTDLTECCRNKDTEGQGRRGEWYYPDGRVVQNNADSTAAGEDFYRVRNAPQVIRLSRRVGNNPLSPTGSYCCVIPTTGGEMTFCINIGISYRNYLAVHLVFFLLSSFHDCSCMPASPSDQWEMTFCTNLGISYREFLAVYVSSSYCQHYCSCMPAPQSDQWDDLLL